MSELDELSEEGFDEARRASARGAADDPGADGRSAATGRRLPRIFELLGVEEEPLAPGEVVVCHHRKGAVVATERHAPSRRGI